MKTALKQLTAEFSELGDSSLFYSIKVEFDLDNNVAIFSFVEKCYMDELICEMLETFVSNTVLRHFIANNVVDDERGLIVMPLLKATENTLQEDLLIDDINIESALDLLTNTYLHKSMFENYPLKESSEVSKVFDCVSESLSNVGYAFISDPSISLDLNDDDLVMDLDAFNQVIVSLTKLI